MIFVRNQQKCRDVKYCVSTVSYSRNSHITGKQMLTLKFYLTPDYLVFQSAGVLLDSLLSFPAVDKGLLLV